MRQRATSLERAWSLVAGAGLVVGLAAGCASTGAVQVVEMEPLEFRARHNGERVVVDTLDPDVLFEEGTVAYKAKRLEEAASAFETLVEHFEDHALAQSARFDAALCREELGHTEAALGWYQDYVDHAPGEGDRVDGLVRVAECVRKLGRWDELRGTCDALLKLRLNVMERVHVLALSGLAWQRLHELARAERDFERVLALHDEHSDLPMFRHNYYVAMAHYHIGEIYHTLFRGIELRLPVERMERDLDDKSKLFLKSQHAYLRSVRVKNGHWGVAAGFQVGAIYEDFYEDFLAAEIPSDLSNEEVAVYLQELRLKVRPLIDRAVEVYETSVRMSERIGLDDSEWTQRARERLEELKALVQEFPPQS